MFIICKSCKKLVDTNKHDFCPKCGSKIVMKTGKKKTIFYSCEKYPTCDFSSWDLPTIEKCPECGEMLFRKKGQSMIVCHAKDCGYKREIAPEALAIEEK